MPVSNPQIRMSDWKKFRVAHVIDKILKCTYLLSLAGSGEHDLKRYLSTRILNKRHNRRKVSIDAIEVQLNSATV